MSSYRFSPITSKTALYEALRYVHIQGHLLAKKTLHRYLPVAGNIGIFCHSDAEFEQLILIRDELIDQSTHWNHKYFKLISPIVFSSELDIPETTYRYLYIRPPEATQTNVGDVDFYLPKEAYEEMKQNVADGTYTGVSLLVRPDLELIRLEDPSIDVLSFVGSYDLDTIVSRSQKREQA